MEETITEMINQIYYDDNNTNNTEISNEFSKEENPQSLNVILLPFNVGKSHLLEFPYKNEISR